MKLTPTEIIECLIRGNHSRCSSKYAKFGCKPAINLNSAPFFFFGSKMTTVNKVPVDYPSQEGGYKTGPQDYARIITIVFPTEKPRGRSLMMLSLTGAGMLRVYRSQTRTTSQ